MCGGGGDGGDNDDAKHTLMNIALKSLVKSTTVLSVGTTPGFNMPDSWVKNCLWMAWINSTLPKTESISCNESMAVAVLLPPLLPLLLELVGAEFLPVALSASVLSGS